MKSFNLVQTIFENTRITRTSVSCIDNIFTNSHFLQAKAFEHFISDHTAQKIIFKADQDTNNQLRYIRIFSEENKNSFLGSLQEQNWLTVYDVEKSDVNMQWNVFMGSFKLIFNQHFPLKLSSKKCNLIAPDSPELVECK